VARLSHQFESFTLAIMIWVGNICTCVTDDHIHVFLPFIEVTISSSPLWWFISGFCTRVSWKRVSRLFCLVFWGFFYHCLSFVLFPLAIVFSIKSIVHSQTLPITTWNKYDLKWTNGYLGVLLTTIWFQFWYWRNTWLALCWIFILHNISKMNIRWYGSNDITTPTT
jgi:hypothetical protein